MAKRKQCFNSSLLTSVCIQKLIHEFVCSSFNDRHSLQLVAKEWQKLCNDDNLVKNIPLLLKFKIDSTLNSIFYDIISRVKYVCFDSQGEDAVNILGLMINCEELQLNGGLNPPFLNICSTSPRLQKLFLSGMWKPTPMEVHNAEKFNMQQGWQSLTNLNVQGDYHESVLNFFSGAPYLKKLRANIPHFKYHKRLCKLHFPNLKYLLMNYFRLISPHKLDSFKKEFPRLKQLHTESHTYIFRQKLRLSLNIHYA